MASYPTWSDNIKGFWNAYGEFQNGNNVYFSQPKPDIWSIGKNEELIEHFSSSTNYQDFLYSFSVILYTIDSNGLKTQYKTSSVSLKKLTTDKIKEVEFHINNTNIMNSSFYVVITDLTAYRDGQPLLKLKCLIDDGVTSYPVVFGSTNPSDASMRQISFTLQPFNKMSFLFA